MAKANGVAAAAAMTTGGLRRSRRRSNGAARPAASTVQAAARIAVGRGTDAPNISRGADGPGTGSRPTGLWRAGLSAPLRMREGPGGLGGEGPHDLRARVHLRVPLD